MYSTQFPLQFRELNPKNASRRAPTIYQNCFLRGNRIRRQIQFHLLIKTLADSGNAYSQRSSVFKGHIIRHFDLGRCLNNDLFRESTVFGLQ